MKIAILTSGILPVPAVQGGAVENLIDFYLEYNNIHKLHDITVFSVYHPLVEKHQALSSSSNHYIFININSLWFNIRRFLFKQFCPKGYYYSSIEYFLELVIRQLQKGSFDLIVIENRPGYALKLRKKFPKTPIISHMHTNMLNNNIPRAKEIISSTTAFFAVSMYIKNEIESVGIPTKIVTVYNGLDTSLFDVNVSPIKREQLGFNEQDFLVIFCGRLVKDKGIKELLYAMKVLQDKKDVKLLVIGSEDFSKESRQSLFISELHQIANNIEDKIKFTGFIPYNKLAPYLSAANVMVVPSHINEAFGMTCIEASAMGLPIIATNDGGIHEALIGQKHILIDKEQDLPSQIADAIIKIKNNYSAYLGNHLNYQFTKETFAKSFFEELKKIK